MVEVLDPRGSVLELKSAAGVALPAEPRSILVLDNSKANADALFSEIVAGLNKAFPKAVLRVARKPSAGNPCPPEEFDRIVVERPELVITGTGD
jgi:hypothetical protein